MPNVQHSALTAASGIHVLQAWEAANAAARTAIVGVAADVGKVCRQADDGSYWVLTAAPSTWTRIDAAAGASTALKYVTWGSEVVSLPNSFNLVEGTGVRFDNPAANTLIISTAPTAVVQVSASRTITVTDAGNILRCTAAGVSLTVPTNAVAAVATGATILVIAAASGYVQMASGVTLASALNPTGSSAWKYKLVEGGSVLLAKLSTNAWHLTGSYDLEAV